MINFCGSELILTPFGLDFFSYTIKHRIKTIYFFLCFISNNLCGFKLACSRNFFWIYGKLHNNYNFCHVFISCNYFFLSRIL